MYQLAGAPLPVSCGTSREPFSLRPRWSRSVRTPIDGMLRVTGTEAPITGIFWSPAAGAVGNGAAGTGEGADGGLAATEDEAEAEGDAPASGVSDVRTAQPATDSKSRTPAAAGARKLPRLPCFLVVIVLIRSAYA